jgi:hypothetical protein
MIVVEEVEEEEKSSLMESSSTKMVMASLEDSLPVIQQQRSPEPQQLSGSEQLSFATQLREKEEELEEARTLIIS